MSDKDDKKKQCVVWGASRNAPLKESVNAPSKNIKSKQVSSKTTDND